MARILPVEAVDTLLVLLLAMALSSCGEKELGDTEVSSPTTTSQEARSSDRAISHDQTQEWQTFLVCWEDFSRSRAKKRHDPNGAERLREAVSGLGGLRTRGVLSAGEADLIRRVVSVALDEGDSSSFYGRGQEQPLDQTDLGGTDLVDSEMGRGNGPRHVRRAKTQDPAHRPADAEQSSMAAWQEEILALQNDLPYIEAAIQGGIATDWTESNVMAPLRGFIREAEETVGPLDDGASGAASVLRRAKSMLSER